MRSPWLVAGTTALAFWSAQLAVGLVAQWMAVRVRFDARLFARLADDGRSRALAPAHLDRALRGVGTVPRDKEGRDWDTRCRGALDLVRTLGLIVVMQVVFAGVAGTIAARRLGLTVTPTVDKLGAGAIVRLRARADRRAHAVDRLSRPPRAARLLREPHSHGDFALIWACLPDDLRERTRPVAGADYWVRAQLRRYVAERVFRAVLIDRNRETRKRGPDQADGRRRSSTATR